MSRRSSDRALVVRALGPALAMLEERLPGITSDVPALLAHRGGSVVDAAAAAGLVSGAELVRLRKLVADDGLRASVLLPALAAPSEAAEPLAPPPAAPACTDTTHRRLLAKVDDLTAKRDLWKGRYDNLVAERDGLMSESATLNATISALQATLDERDRLLRLADQRASSVSDVARTLSDLLSGAGGDPREMEQRALGQADDPVAASLEPTGVTREQLAAALDGLVAGPPAPVVVVRERTLRVTPLGGGTEIGGSAILVEAGGTRVLVDAGIRPQGGTNAELAPPQIAAALDGPLDAIVVTHAHNDHGGYIPALLAQRPGVPVLASPGTAALLPTMWRDSAKVYANRTETEQRYGLARDVLYGPVEVALAENCLRSVPLGRPTAVGQLTIELFAAGHIVGAAGVVVAAGGERVVVTGDIAGFPQASVGGYALPESAVGADLLVLETTYCGEAHRRREDEVARLIATIADVVSADGRVLVPAFALGRAQEVALSIHQHLPDVPVLVDGMAREVSTLVTAHTGTAVITGNISRVGDRVAAMRNFRSGVVISTSGMLTGGPAVAWAHEILPDPAGALLLCGYQDEESPGRALLELADSAGDRKLRLPGRDRDTVVDVRARVDRFGLSAHADRDGLRRIVDEVSPSAVMLVHGYPAKQRQFGELLAMHGHAVVPTGPWGAD